MLAAVVQIWDTSCAHCVKVGIGLARFILIRLTQHVSGIIMPIVRRTDYVNNCMWSMPACVGCSRAELGHELCALCESWYTSSGEQTM